MGWGLSIMRSRSRWSFKCQKSAVVLLASVSDHFLQSVSAPSFLPQWSGESRSAIGKLLSSEGKERTNGRKKKRDTAMVSCTLTYFVSLYWALNGLPNDGSIHLLVQLFATSILWSCLGKVGLFIETLSGLPCTHQPSKDWVDKMRIFWPLLLFRTLPQNTISPS